MVLGLTKSLVLDSEEVRRKRLEDALACGRVVTTITKPTKRQTCPTITIHDTSGELPVEESAKGDAEKDYYSLFPVQPIPLLPSTKTHNYLSTVFTHMVLYISIENQEHNARTTERCLVGALY